MKATGLCVFDNMSCCILVTTNLQAIKKAEPEGGSAKKALTMPKSLD